MIKNIVFDIGNVILNFRQDEVITEFFEREKSLDFNYIQNEDEARRFIKENIINSPEWLKDALIDTGYITKEDAIHIVNDRTNNAQPVLIERFWNTYNKCSHVDNRVVDLIRQLKRNGYKVYLLSNINQHTIDNVDNTSRLFDIVNGGTYSYKVHQIKPYKAIYNTFLTKYELVPEECVFIDNSQRNIDTALELGFDARKVNDDDYDSIYDAVKEFLDNPLTTPNKF